MRTGFIGSAVFAMVLAGMLSMPAFTATPDAPVTVASPAFREFARRVDDYLKMQKAVPRVRTTRDRRKIVERRAALARKIRETRANAKPGDIFTPEVSEEFRKVIRGAFQGASAPNVRKTIRQGEPLRGWRLSVNADYPEQLPVTTVPPTLLLRLPQLPPEVAYRIIGHDFVLQDKEARVVIDFIPAVLP